MKKHLCIVAAAALAVGGMNLSLRAQDAPADNPLERAAENTGEAARDAGQATGEAARDAAEGTRGALGIDDKPSANAEEIHDVLAQVAEAAMTKGGLDDMVERFVDADRNRIGQNDDALSNNADLDGRIAQLQEDWKAKYNQEFDIGDEDKVLGSGGFAMIREGEIGGDARTAGERVDVDANVDADAGRAKVNVDNDTGVDVPRADTGGQTAADTNRNDPGRNIATVTIQASHGMPEVKVPMIHEAGGWKIDVPDSVDAAKLRESVQTALTKCGEMKAEWPQEADAAYRAVTHQVLASLFADASSATGSDAAQPGAAQPPAGQSDPAAPAPATPATPATPSEQPEQQSLPQ